MSKTDTVRQAQLRPECAGRYPALPARMWTSAASLAQLVASYHLAGKVRPLLEADFEFRGGRHRWFAGLIAHTRVGETAFNWAG